MPDPSGHVATRRDDLHTMTLSELEAKIAQAGIVMSHRQIMRHCKAGTFDAQKLPATNNVEEWFIAPGSVEKGIADIKTLQALRSRRDTTRRDMSGSDGAELGLNTAPDMSSHDATRRDMSETQNQDDRGLTQRAVPGHVVLLEKRIEEKEEVIGLLKGQLVAKDEQIKSLNQRFSETQSLLGAMQRMLAPLLGQADPFTKGEGREVNSVPATDVNNPPGRDSD